MKRLLQATSIVAAAGVAWAGVKEVYDRITTPNEITTQEAQLAIDDTLSRLDSCLDDNMSHEQDIYGLNWMYWRGLSECIPLYSVFKSYPFVFNTEAAKAELSTIMNNNPEFFERFQSDIELLKDETLLSRLQRFRSHMTVPIWINNPYDIENDPEGFCEIAECDSEHIRTWYEGDEAYKNFDGVYMIVKEEYATAYNLVGMFQRNWMDYKHFANFIEELLSTSTSNN